MASGEAEAKPVAEEEHHNQEHKSSPSGSVFQPGQPKNGPTQDGFLASKHAQHHHHPIDIDENTPVDAVRAPGCFNRLKEEVEAVVETIAEKMHLKKPSA